MLKSAGFIPRRCQCAAFALSSLTTGELQLRPGPWDACMALQGYSVFLEGCKSEHFWPLPSDMGSENVWEWSGWREMV